MKKKVRSTIIHEVTRAEHRIVVINPDGTNTCGVWRGLTEVATNGKLHAIVGESDLPQGVFTCSEQAHQVLS